MKKYTDSFVDLASRLSLSVGHLYAGGEIERARSSVDECLRVSLEKLTNISRSDHERKFNTSIAREMSAQFMLDAKDSAGAEQLLSRALPT